VEPVWLEPDALQRQQLTDAVPSRQLKTAVVTDSLIGRGIVTAFKWYGLNLEAFKPSAIEDAFRFVSASADETKWLRETLVQLQSAATRSGRAAAG
jgi:hypothetical protein